MPSPGSALPGSHSFKHYKEILSHELGIEPNEEMVALYKQVATGQTTPASKQKTNNPVFLIADIEKAPIYWARAGDKKNEILATYANILKETARRFGGIVLQKSEDNVTLLFESGQPLHCAVTVHLKIKKADWGELGPPNIRMVLYSTFLEGENPGNFAMLTQSASSLLSISWGGQIVFTEQTLRLLDVPSGSNLKDLGFHFLNETEGSIHVYELLHPHLPSIEHPPLQSGVQQLANFPFLTPPFVGREQELEQLSHLLLSREDRLISLIGPGGIGKTRLAVQAASQISEHFPDGVYFISLASIQDPDFIPILIADALKFTFFGPTDHIEQLIKFLHRLTLLLVIDNFEHLRAEGAKKLALLLAQTHYVKILLTTRERLNMISETVLEVHGLPVPAFATPDIPEHFSSIILFTHNAQKTYPRFSDQNNIEAIIRICRLVDGIPLAILLASSWVRVFSCSEIASEIKKNIDFLTTSAPDIDPRHRSLRAVFENSWKLLSQEERCILRRLSVFQVAFTPKAAQEICGATPLYLSIFTDKSLLNHPQEGSFEMLATFHQYAHAKLEEDIDELVATKLKFCEFYAGLCAQKQVDLDGPNQRNAITEILSEMENIRTAWAWMVDSDRWDLVDQCKNPLLTYHIIVGDYLQGNELFRHALLKLNRLYPPEFDLLRASMQQFSAWMTFRNGFATEAKQRLTECLEVFRSHNADWDVALTLLFLAEVNRSGGEFHQAKNLIEECLLLMNSEDVPKSNHHTAIEAHCKSLRGMIYMEMGDYGQAQRNLEASLSTNDIIGNDYGTIHPLMGLARLAYTQGEYFTARDLYLQALDTATHIYDQRGMVLIHNNLSAVYEEIANISESHHHVLTALKLCEETGDRRLTAVILNNLAYHQLRYLDHPAEAIRTYHECMAIFSEIGDLRGITYSSYDVSKAYIKVGLYYEAWKYCLQSLNTAMTLDSTPLILHSLHGFANLFARTNDPARGLGLCHLIANHPQVEPDTQKRAIVSKVELGSVLPPATVRSAQSWGEKANLQDVINQILIEKPPSP